MTKKVLAVLVCLFIITVSPLFAQEVFQISGAYSCVRFADGTSYVSQNSSTPGELTIIEHNLAFKTLKADRKVMRGRIEVLKELRSDIVFGKFDKADKKTLKGLLDIYFPSDEVMDTRKKRLNATNELIKHLRSEIELSNAVEKAITDCLGKIPGGKPGYLRYGQLRSVTVKPVIVPGSAAFNYREAYVGYLLLIDADKSINLASKKQIGTRSGYVACIKNISSGRTFYAIFSDQPCEDVNFSPQFPDKPACKNHVPADHWGSFGYWAPVSAVYPSPQDIQSSYDFLLANVRPYFQAVIYGADPYQLSGGPSQLDFRSWCSTGTAF